VCVCVCVCTDGDGGQQSFWYVGDDDSNKEDDGVEPVVPKNECDNEERKAKEDGDTSDEVNEMSNLSCDWRIVHCQTGSQVSDATHHGTISGVDDYTTGCTY